jgi:hypothetical protein
MISISIQRLVFLHICSYTYPLVFTLNHQHHIRLIQPAYFAHRQGNI